MNSRVKAITRILSVSFFFAGYATAGDALVAPGAEDIEGLPANSHSLRALCDVRSYGAKGDGVTKDTAAIQSAILQCPVGGVVVLPNSANHSTYLTGTIYLKSDMTLRIEPGATLKGSRDDADYPDLLPPTENSQLGNCRKSLIYAEGVHNVAIEGGQEPDSSGKLTSYGVVDGNGNSNPNWQGPERTRPMAIFLALSNGVTIRRLQVLNSGMWTVVNFENTGVLIDSVRVNSPSGPTRDGIDVVDCSHVLIQNVDVYSEDDSICLKSGSTKGVHDVVVRNSIVRNSLVANALKLGTASSGSFDSVSFESIRIDSARQAAMAVESVDGARIDGIHFKNIVFNQTGTAFFVILGRRAGAPAIGSVRHVSFEDITGSTDLNWGSAVTGTEVAGSVYPLQDLEFINVHVKNTSSGGLASVPAPPPEYGGQYPDPRMWNPLPSSGIFFRHVDGLVFQGVSFEQAPGDPRAPVMGE